MRPMSSNFWDNISDMILIFIIMDHIIFLFQSYTKFDSYDVIYFKLYRRLLIWLCYNFINLSEAVYMLL